jgi:transposase
MQKLNDLSRSLIPLEPDRTLICVIELSLKSWLVAGVVPGVARQPLKKLAIDESALLKMLHRWREEAERAGHRIQRIAVAFEAGRDGFWLARWLTARNIEVHVIHASSVAISREHRRAKTDRLDTALLKPDRPGQLLGRLALMDEGHMPAGVREASGEEGRFARRCRGAAACLTARVARANATTP